MTNTEEVLDLYERARQAYTEGDFVLAERELKKYKKQVDYRAMPYTDRRHSGDVYFSVVIVSYQKEQELIDCLDSIKFPPEAPGEIILVDQGGNESIHDALTQWPLLHFQSPLNFAASEARNIGASFARGKILVFLDDDCRADRQYFSALWQAFQTFDFIALRGRILPKTPDSNNSIPRHYDLGLYPIPAALVTEGNMALAKETYEAADGMHPLMFGLEGVEFTSRLLEKTPEKDIYYWPGMLIYHDHLSWQGRAAKKRRHAHAREYLKSKGSRHGDLTAQYNNWYDDRPGAFRRYESRSRIVRSRQMILDGLAALLYGRKR